ncbi:uncharacterized protein LOC133531548 isoform X1 [Cydia pomonella]|uniref:uncharacterized protein LOC133531548 isoform X1 n=1 Tax=Cydia pomonella TaxID=82600 RepID=UPI002ADE5C74|nr:uncharacterized protein LOC133531548 isoform X1 [Cydia pomonella]XP_061725806.1 uncharacterized protein LOC133531548 isoform X1 [Cydia pomonella]XP_061725807.1 uncharacterized protein LOC133531548 isoform X1 [Cydia pomonella]
MPIIKSAVQPEAGCTGVGALHISKLDFGECRFCETQGEHTNMMSEQVLRDGQENYFDMLLDCFNVFLATDSSISSLICGTCAQRLRDAREFKRLVLRAQGGVRRAAAAFDGNHPDTYPNIKLEPEDPMEPEDPEPDPLRLSEVVVKSEPDMDIVEHGLTRTVHKSGVREDGGASGTHGDGQPEPKKQRLETSKIDSILAGMLSSCTEESTEQETQNDQYTYACSSDSVAAKFREEYYKSIPREEKDNSLDSLFEIPDRDIIDLDEATMFFNTGCGCRLSCLDKFDRNQVLKSRLDCLEQNYYCYHHINHLNLMLLGAISATARIGLNNKREKQSRAHVAYWFRGTPVCKKFFLFVYGGLTNTKYEKILKCFKARGVESLTHHCKKPLMTRQQKADVIAFINNFSEQNSLVLPGRSLTKTDLHILPSSVTRTSLYERYVRACTRNNTYPLRRPLWYKCWDDFCPNVTVSVPSNPCVTCDDFVSELSESQTENDKKKCLGDALDHLNDVQMQRGYYQNIIAQITPSVMMNSLSLGQHAPCSYEGLAHYSFDYLQQIHLPHNPDQTGPQDFLNNYKVSLFGVAIEPLDKFVLYVIPEYVPKGIILLISLLHNFFENFALGETHVVCHSTNLCKNNTLIQYAVWRVLSGLHKSFQLSFLPSGHSNFAPDLYFGLFKSIFRESNASCLEHVCEIAANAVTSGSITSVMVANETGESYVNNYNWREFFTAHVPASVPELLMYNHFKTESLNPCSVMCSKSSPNNFSAAFRIIDIKFDLNMPKIIEPQRLSLERQKYLYENIRKYVSPEFQDILCPIPNRAEEVTNNSNQSGTSKVEGDQTEPKILLDLKIEQDGHSDKETSKKRKPTTCSYCGDLGHKNECKQGVYSCPKRQLKTEPYSKTIKKCAYCIPNNSVLDPKLKEVYMEICNCKMESQTESDMDHLNLVDSKEDQVNAVESIQGGSNKKLPVCSYCGLPGHRNQVRHGIYFCKKRQKDKEAAVKELTCFK